MKKYKRILIAIPSFTYGGAENHGFVIAKVLKSMGYEPIMFSFSKRTDAVAMYKNEGISCLQYHNPVLLYDPWYIKIVKAIKFMLFVRKQTIHAIVSTTFDSNFNFGMVWKFAGVKRLYWHKFGEETGIPVTKFERYIIRTKPTYICNSEWMKESIVKRHNLPQTADIYVINNAVFERPIIETREQWRKKLQIEHDAIVLTMTANFFPEKDFETLLNAFKKLINIHADTKLYLLLAGNAPGASPEKLRIKALAFDLKLQNEVKFIDATPDVFGLYAASDVGVLSTLSEGFSNSLLEYMWCGLPVVATDIPPNREALPQECHSFLFEPKNVDDCVKKLSMFVNNVTLRNDVRNVNKEYARKNFTLKNFIEKYKNVFVE